MELLDLTSCKRFISLANQMVMETVKNQSHCIFIKGANDFPLKAIFVATPREMGMLANDVQNPCNILSNKFKVG